MPDPATPPAAPRRLEVSAASLAALEYPSLLALIAALAASDLGRDEALALLPLADRDALAERRAAYDEAARLLAGGALVPSFETPLQPLLDRAGGAPPGLLGRDVVALMDLLEATAAATARIADADPACPALAARAALLPDSEPLRRLVRKTLDRRGDVREDASPELSRLRGVIRRQRDTLYQDLQGLVQEHRELLSEETVPMREGRLVLVLQAGARGRVPGLVHGRSSTGKSFYFEPLGVVEGNNRLQQAWEEEEAERQRLLAELAAELRRQLPMLAAHADFLAGLDVLQAALRFAETARARLPELVAAPRLRLVQARHPLLDGALAPLREEALGQPGHTGAVVPLDLELSPDRRALVITGPNAGGKTVALKTAGLLSLMALAGLPVPAAGGTTLPELERLVATVGDEQDMLADRSTFSGRLLRLREAWDAAPPPSLVLLDELGSGTDPEEGSALAGALLEGLVARGALVVLTTHLGRLAGEAMQLPGAFCAAMDFEPETGEPRYRLLPGPPGSSEAIALARRLGFDRALLASAEARLSREGRDYRRLLAEVERLRGELAARLGDAESEAARATAERQRLERERAAMEAERRTLAPKLKRELDSFRRQVRQELAAEVERVRGEAEGGRRRGVAEAATERLFAAAPGVVAEPEPEAEAPLQVGGRVRHRMLGWQGTLEKLDRGRAEVTVSGKRLRCREEELVGLAGGGGGAAAGASGQAGWGVATGAGGRAGGGVGGRAGGRVGGGAGAGLREGGASRSDGPPAGGGTASAAAAPRLTRAERLRAAAAAARSGMPSTELPRRDSAPPELMLLGERVETALERLDGYLDEALLAGREEVRVVHGHGTGKLRQAVREHLRGHRAVATFRPGEEGEGGNGATVVRLRG